MWRNAESNRPSAFVFHGVTMVSPDGTVQVVEGTNGQVRNQHIVTCSFVIPVGPNAGKTVYFTGFFVP